MKESHYGPCGLYCAACGEPTCGGCLSDHVHDWGKRCVFRQCTKDKDVDFCCFCSDYPCPELQGFMNDEWPHHWTMEPNLKFIRKNGVKSWLQAQQQEWSCDNCGAEVKWYQRMCRCGQPLDAWDLPA